MRVIQWRDVDYTAAASVARVLLSADFSTSRLRPDALRASADAPRAHCLFTQALFALLSPVFFPAAIAFYLCRACRSLRGVYVVIVAERQYAMLTPVVA